MYFKHNLVTSHSFDISETFVKLSPICRNRAGLCRTAHWSLETRPYRFTMKKPFSTRGSFPAFCLFPPDRTHLSFISPFTISPVLLDPCGSASGGQLLHCPLAHPSMGNYPRERRQLGTLEWWSSEQGTVHSKHSETPQLPASSPSFTLPARRTGSLCLCSGALRSTRRYRPQPESLLNWNGCVLSPPPHDPSDGYTKVKPRNIP